ncbi:hypothetical protein [Paragemmobacter straminiformis]
MVSRLPGAIIRAILVMALAVLPSVVLPGMSADAKQMAALVALFVGLMTFVEYNSAAPSLIEFRDAAPFNRFRFGLLFAVVLLLTLSLRDAESSGALTALVAAVAGLLAHLLDFQFSPVRLAALMLDPASELEAGAKLREAAALAYAVSLLGMLGGVMLLQAVRWPWRGPAFNVWINLPTFDPTAGHDVIIRLRRDALVNVALGVFLPFLVPAGVRLILGGFEAAALASAQTLIWTMAAWAFLPASLVLRGVAMLRVAWMVEQKRRDTALAFDEGPLLA